MNNFDHILSKYNLKFSKEKERILREYVKIEELDYSRRNIERCPSILYRNLKSIKNNYDFLKEKRIYNYNIETCLHILSSNENDLVNTYYYVEKIFGKDIFNKNTTILRIKKDRIEWLKESPFIIIDEISMVHSYLIDILDVSLKYYLKNSKPF